MQFFKRHKAATLAFLGGVLVAGFIWSSGEDCREICEEHLPDASYAHPESPDTCLCQRTTVESLWVPMSKGATEAEVVRCHAPTPEGCEG